NLICVPVLLFCGLYLTHVSVRDAARSSFDTAMPLFRRDMRMALAENVRRQRLNELFQEHCQKRNMCHGWPIGYGKRVIDFTVPFKGIIVDIDVRAMDTLDLALRKHAKGSVAYINLIIGQQDVGVPLMKLVSGDPYEPNRDNPARTEIVLSKEAKHVIREALK